jgi:hypothetical protein
MRSAIVCALALLASPAVATCPENIIWKGCWDGVGQTSTDATADATTKMGPWSAGQPCAAGCYDLTHGTLVANGAGGMDSPGCFSRVLVQDTYQVVGPAGPALTFEAVLQVSATMSGNAGYRAGIAQSWINPGDEQCTGGTNCEAAISLSYAPGASFPVWAVVDAGGFHPEGLVTAQGVIRFRGLPEGYRVVSCQNYDLPTPARPSSWGGVKALYR